MDLKETFKYLCSFEDKRLKKLIVEFSKKRTYQELIDDSLAAEKLFKELRKLRRERSLTEFVEKNPISVSSAEKPSVYTIEEVCKIIKKKRSSLYNLRRSGKLVPLNTDEKRTKVLYSRDAVEKYLGGVKI